MEIEQIFNFLLAFFGGAFPHAIGFFLLFIQNSRTVEQSGQTANVRANNSKINYVKSNYKVKFWKLGV